METMEKGTIKNNNSAIAVRNYYGKGEHLHNNQLGWQYEHRNEARSDISYKIFHYYVCECRFNLAFYYVDNDTFYGLHTERLPIEFKVLPRDRSKEFISWQCECNTHDDGQVLFSFDNPELIWDTVVINGKTLEDMLERSEIITIN